MNKYQAIVELIADGLTYKQCAERLGITVGYVGNIIYNKRHHWDIPTRNHPWTVDEIERVQQYMQNGHRVQWIAKKIGVTTSAIYHKFRVKATEISRI